MTFWNNRHCLQCHHCRLDIGWGGSDVTPPEGNTFACTKGHWTISEHECRGDIRKSLAANMEQATECTDFQDDV